MGFIKRFSIRQELSLAAIVISLFFMILIFWFRQNPMILLIQFFGFLVSMIVISTMFFFSEYSRKIEIQQNEYDNKFESPLEKEFASYLKRKNIRYQFHPRVKIKSKKGDIECKPDFYLPEFEVYVEIWGKIDDKIYKDEYFRFKRDAYKNNQIECIDIYPKNFKNLDWNFTMKLLEIFKERQGIHRSW